MAISGRCIDHRRFNTDDFGALVSHTLRSNWSHCHGLVVGSVRGLVLERTGANDVRRHLWNQRERWRKNINARQQLGQPLTSIKSDATAIKLFRRFLRSRTEDHYVERRLSRLPPAHEVCSAAFETRRRGWVLETS